MIITTSCPDHGEPPRTSREMKSTCSMCLTADSINRRARHETGECYPPECYWCLEIGVSKIWQERIRQARAAKEESEA